MPAPGTRERPGTRGQAAAGDRDEGGGISGATSA